MTLVPYDDQTGPVIRVRGLVNRFGSQVIDDGIDLDVMRGEILGVVGGSGSGKWRRVSDLPTLLLDPELANLGATLFAAAHATRWAEKSMLPAVPPRRAAQGSEPGAASPRRHCAEAATSAERPRSSRRCQ